MKYPVTNTTKMPIYVGALMIPPGETRHFDLEQLPPEHRPAPAADDAEPAAPPDRLAEIAEMNVGIIIPLLPDLSDDDLARLQAIEQDGKNRKTVIEAMGAEILKRATAKADGKE